MTETSTADTAANREIVRQAFDSWRQGTGAVTAVFAPGARFTTSEPFRPVAIRSVYADGDTVTVVWDGRGIATDGLPCENSYIWIMRLNDGQVIDGTACYDSISFNDLWVRVQPG